MTGVAQRPPGTFAIGRRAALGLGAACAGGTVLGAAVPSWAQAERPQPSPTPILLPDTGAHLGAVRAVAVSPNGALIATGSADRSLRIWSGQTGRLLRSWRPPLDDGQVGIVDAVDFSPDGTLLFVTAVDWVEAPRGIIYVFDVETGSIRRTVGSRSGVPWRYPGLAVSPVGGVVALATEIEGVTILRYDASLGVRIGLITAAEKDNPTIAVAFSPDGASVAALLKKNMLRVLPVTDRPGSQTPSIQQQLPGEPVSLAFSADGRRIAVGFANRKAVGVLDRATGQISMLEPPTPAPGNLALVAWGPGNDGTEYLFAGGTIQQPGAGNLVFAWRGGRAGPALAVEVSQDSVGSMARHPSGGVVFGSSDASWGRVQVDRAGSRLVADVTRSERLDFREMPGRRWSIDAGGGVIEFQAKQRGQAPLRFDLAELQLYDASAGPPRPDLRKSRSVPARLPGDLVRRGERVRSTDQAPGTGLVVAGTDETLVLLDPTGVEIARRLIATPAWAVAFSGDGRVIVAAHGDGTLRWYGMAPAAPLYELGGLFVQIGRRKWVAWRNDGRFAYSELGGETLVGIHENGRIERGVPGALTSRWTTVDQQYRRLYDLAAVRSMAQQGPHWFPGGQGAVPELNAATDRVPSVRVVQVCSSAELPEQSRRTRLIATLDKIAAPEPEGTAAASVGVCQDVQPSLQGDTGMVQVDAGTKAVRVRLELADASAPVMVDAFVNGVNAGRAFYAPGKPAEQVILLPAKEAQIEFRAYGPDNAFKRSAPIVVSRRGVPKNEPPTVAQQGGQPLVQPPVEPAVGDGMLHVLAVGIDRYTGTIPALRYAVSDANTFSATMRRVLPRAYGSMAPPIVLPNEAATLDAVREAMVTIALRAKQNDAVMIYLSGHGVSVGGEYAFVTANVKDANAALERADGCLRSEALVGLLSDIRAARTLLLLDTCFANAIDLQVGGRLGHESGRYILTASGSDEEALDGYDNVNGVFGHAVQEALTNVSPASGGVLDALEMCRYVRDRVGTLALQRKHNQRAHFQAAGELIAFPVAQIV